MRLRQALVAVPLMLAATGAGIAAASALVPSQSGSEGQPDSLVPGPGELMTGARAAGEAGRPEWAVRTYISRTGRLCVERGRLSAGEFGDIGADGELEPRPAGPTGICGEDPVVAAVDRIAASPATPDVTLVYGASLRRPVSVTVAPEGEPPVALPVGPRGSFIGRFPGLRPPRSLPLTVEMADGTTRTITWEDPGP